ncbi:hypothetical protein [Steroidobacter sp.]|uniref:hypothetical protein n=1 Tax=Steroidobacter sp. TaxID=1978227 RepID=UPI001A43C722|nr:hypothetical protein [Steroidobacter sp.]MBL8267230.1 hypothetical protein [Steroidobacter sp.]
MVRGRDIGARGGADAGYSSGLSGSYVSGTAVIEHAESIELVIKNGAIQAL